MTLATSRLHDATLTTPALAPTFNEARPLTGPGPLGRARAVVGDMLTGLAIVFCIPLVILGVGIPIALGVRLLLWIAELL